MIIFDTLNSLLYIQFVYTFNSLYHFQLFSLLIIIFDKFTAVV